MTTAPLPIDRALPRLLEALAAAPNAVLHAPPGAGKTTRVPLALMAATWAGAGRVIMLEPRRIAARSAAERMAESLGEAVGATVGYRIRDERRICRNTRIEVVTEGVLARKLQADPGLEGVAAVIFDEFHERSIHADLGLALCLDAQASLRPELRLLAMSATLDVGAVSEIMGRGGVGDDDGPAPMISTEGRSYPVETRWLSAPEKLGPKRSLATAAAELTIRASREVETGDALVFLPGAREIRETARRLDDALPAGVEILPLYGDLPFAEQRRALSPARTGARKIVLATAIAETSLTIDGVTLVIDAGYSRRARFDSGAGMSRLSTTRVSRASAEQRRGRAGRTAPGVCYRMWSRAEEGALPACDPPEILESDLAPLALELAEWGASADQLRFLNSPPEAGLAEARMLLRDLGALDSDRRITTHGRALLKAPLHPRLAHMVICAGGDPRAVRLAALLSERDPLRGAGVDLEQRLGALAAPKRHGAAGSVLCRLAASAERLRRRSPKRSAPAAADLSVGALVSLAYPDRIARRRPGPAPRYLLSGGRGAKLDEADMLAGQDWLAVADLDGDPRESRIRLAAPVALSELEALHEARISEVEDCRWSSREKRVRARRERRLGAVVLSAAPWLDPPPDAMRAAMLEGVANLGVEALPWTAAAERFRARVAFARRADPSLPDLSDAALIERAFEWLGPALDGLRGAADLRGLDILPLLEAQLDWPKRQRLEAACPAHFTAPTGAEAPIDYAFDPPRAAIRLQELYGLAEHPVVGGRALTLELLSPARRPIQMTADLPGFWRGTYRDVAKEMRGRYPKHSWPENPITAAPTHSVKRRKK